MSNPTRHGRVFERRRVADGRRPDLRIQPGRRPDLLGKPPPPSRYSEFLASLHQEGPSRGSSRSTSARSSSGRGRSPAPASAPTSSGSSRARPIDDPSQRVVGALLRPPGAGEDPVRRPGHPLGPGAISSPSPPARARSHEAEDGEDSALLLGPRRAPAPLSRGPGLRADLPADPLPGRGDPGRAGQGREPTPRPPTGAGSASCSPTGPATRP